MDLPYMDATSRAEIEYIRKRNRIAKRRSRARQRQKQNGVFRDEDQPQNTTATGEAPMRELGAPTLLDQFPSSGSSAASEGGSSAGAFEHIEPDNESPSWIHPVPPPPATPADQFQDCSSAGTFGHVEPDSESPSWIHPVPPPPVTPADQFPDSSATATFRYVEPDNESPSWIQPVPPVTPADQFQDNSFATCPAMGANDLDLAPFEPTAPFTAFGGSTTASPDFSSLCTVYQQPVQASTRHRSSGSTGNGSSSGLLHLAVRNGSKTIAQALLTAGASANSRDGSGALPLHLAVQHRRRSMADLLLTYGADPDSVNAAGITPLELAVRCRDDEIVNLLISRGARIT